MKAYLNNLKTGVGRVGFYWLESFRSITECNLKMRIGALLVLTGLIMPVIFIGKWQIASAESIAPPTLLPAPVAAPPEPFVLPSSNTISTAVSTKVLSSITSLSTFAGSGYASVTGFFTVPDVPAGLSPALAKPVAPVSALSSSIASSVGTVFGATAPSAAKSVASADAGNVESSADSESESAAAVVMMSAQGSSKFDFDGDGHADIARWQPSTGEWKIKKSNGNTFETVQWGVASDKIVPADYDGDGKTDIAVFRPSNGSWYIRQSSNNQLRYEQLGMTGDIPQPGNYDGTGGSEVAVFRPSNGTWYRQTAPGGSNVIQFGMAGDIPVAGDYDGNGSTDLAVYRPAQGNWYIRNASGGYNFSQWGMSSDIPVPADYDGDGKTDIAVYRPSGGTWYVSHSNGTPYTVTSWGNYGDQPAPADFDGDGKTDIAVWRPTTGAWFIIQSSNNGSTSTALGTPGDWAVSSAYVKQTGSEIYSYDFAKTRLSPKNQMGGTNLYSRNFSWGTGLVNLPGRAGMDAGLGISYNSLVWTKSDQTMVFDADHDNVSPGFRMGYPVIEPAYYDSVSGKFNYLMVTPSGAKVEFKQQVGASDTYETVDSSYTQLKINNTGSPNSPPSDLGLTVTGTDGTQMSYSWIAGAYRCTRIMDSNGNYITIGNNEYGLLRTVTDTLGRVITIEYDAENSPTSIKQNWQGDNGQGTAAPHTYATFNYVTPNINPSFGAPITGVYGPQNKLTKLLGSIVYPDGSSTRFDYNSYGQVFKVSNIAADTQRTLLNYVKTNLESPSPGQSDCPRFSVTKTYVKNFNNEQETVVHNDIYPNQTYTVPGGSESATLIEVSMEGEPNSHVSKTFVGSSGWKEGLPLATEDWASENGSYGRRRWTWTSWAQDYTTQPYILNPRVTETMVGDATNTKRTTVDYEMQPGSLTDSRYGLVNEVKVYAANQTTVLKRSKTEYIPDNAYSSAYSSRRVIGLPSKSELYDENDALISKITYNYDDGDFTDTDSQQNISPVQHDNTNYGAAFKRGRGNLTSTTRHDVTGQTSEVTSSALYNTAGAIVKQTTPGSGVNPTRQVKIDYTDAFYNQPGKNTFAYPTKLTDPDGNFSQVKYRYDIGANVWAKSPDLNATTLGKISTRIFDAVGRLERQTLAFNGAYTRYEYPDNQTESRVFTTVTSTASEVLAESSFDGAGRVIKSRTPMTFDAAGNTATWVGQKTAYDILGRAASQSVPMEINSSWAATGSDANRAWQWTSQQYDWKGRVVKEIGLDNIDRVYSYDGCGCAGGEVTTVQGEEVMPGKRRTQKGYADILGRNYKTETLDWDGNVYTSSVTKYNGRDQVEWVKQFTGAAPADALNSNSCPIQSAGEPQTCQIAASTYDGHGRLKTSHSPQQDVDKSTTYEYNNDDSLHSATDARGAISTYTYEKRGLVSRIDRSLPDAAGRFPTTNPNTNLNSPTSNSPGSEECTIGNPSYPDCDSGPTPSPTPNPQPYLSWTTFGYDGVGNRTNMSDSETGGTTYDYDSLSRMTAEHIHLNDSWNIPNHNYDVQI